MKTTESTRDVCTIVTNRIISQLEHGTVPWRKPWTDAGMPENLISKRAYQGINVWLLTSLGYPHNLFLTLEQLKELNGSVKRNEEANIVIFTRRKEKKVKAKIDRIVPEQILKMPLFSYYKVFNIAQCDGIPAEMLPRQQEDVNRFIDAYEIYTNMPLAPEIYEEHDFAYYHGHGDYVNMPYMEKFDSCDSYYATLFHELVHSTGHASRLNRKAWLKKTSYATSNQDKYSLEELVAEMGACYLESVAGITNIVFQQNAGYIDGWLSKLKSDKWFVVIASALSQRAIDYILNVKRQMM